MYTYYHYYMSQKIESIFICLSFFGHISSQIGLTWRELVYSQVGLGILLLNNYHK